MEEKQLYFYVLDGDDEPLFFEDSKTFLDYIGEDQDYEFTAGSKMLTPTEFRALNDGVLFESEEE